MWENQLQVKVNYSGHRNTTDTVDKIHRGHKRHRFSVEMPTGQLFSCSGSGLSCKCHCHTPLVSGGVLLYDSRTRLIYSILGFIVKNTKSLLVTCTNSHI